MYDKTSSDFRHPHKGLVRIPPGPRRAAMTHTRKVVGVIIKQESSRPPWHTN